MVLTATDWLCEVNLGHLLTAAGMPGIMKMIFAMKEGVLPPSINLDKPLSSPEGLFGSQTLPTRVQSWQNGGIRRCAVFLSLVSVVVTLAWQAYSDISHVNWTQIQRLRPTTINLSITGLASRPVLCKASNAKYCD
ncbi:hypothetical protein O9929_05225 [Vibrio lentus]|nr:hypothetical protein [Vibrio lentus]